MKEKITDINGDIFIKSSNHIQNENFNNLSITSGMVTSLKITYGSLVHDNKDDPIYENNKDFKKNIFIINKPNLSYLLIQNLGTKVYLGEVSLVEIYEENDRKKNFSIRGVHMKELKILNCAFDQGLIITDCVIDKLTISESFLGKITFNGVIIKKFELENATLNDCIFNGCEFPNELEYISDNKKQKDNYRQLKHVMDKNGNYTEANKFYAKEMESYMNSIGLKKRSIFSLLGYIIFTAGFGKENAKWGEKVSLIISDTVNEFGTNLIRSIFVLVIFALLSTVITSVYFYFGNFLFKFHDYPVEKALSYSGIFLTLLVFLISWLLSLIESKIRNYNSSAKTDILVLISLIVGIFLFPKYTYNIDDILYLFDPVKYLFHLLFPIYSIKLGDLTHYSNLEIFYYSLYHIFYGIILWHLIVAAKRATRR